jgi:5-methylcytosine-specific restriction endonuclease McrA
VGESLTLDHIVAEAQGGTWETINLQPLCRACQNKKADLPVETVVVALDMLLRPLPSDSYDGPVW